MEFLYTLQIFLRVKSDFFPIQYYGNQLQFVMERLYVFCDIIGTAGLSIIYVNLNRKVA
jgi:hypothetical protein